MITDNYIHSLRQRAKSYGFWADILALEKNAVGLEAHLIALWVRVIILGVKLLYKG